MPEDTNPSDTGATPASDPQKPAMGNSPAPGVTPQSQVTSSSTTSDEAVKQALKKIAELEEAHAKKISELEHAHNNAKEEAKRHYGKLAKYEQAEKEAQEAQLSEIERVKKKHADLEATHNEYTQRMQALIVRQAVQLQASRMGIIDPEAAAKLLDWSELEYDDDGTPKNAEKLLEKLIKNKPYLAPPAKEEAKAQEQQQPPPTPAQTATPVAVPVLPAMNPGRQNIVAPGTNPPGIPLTLDEVFARSRRNNSR